MSKFHKVNIQEIKRETPEAVSVAFDVPDDLKSDFHYVAGQYVNVKLHLNGEEIIRSYSLSSCLDTDEEWRIAVKLLEGGKASGHFNSNARVGDEIELSAPEGKFVVENLGSEAREHVFFAAGSGITPVRSMIKSILQSEPQSRCVLFYGNRDEENVIFKEELEALAEREGERFSMYYTFSRMNGAAQKYGDHAEGRIDRDKAMLFLKSYVGLETHPVFYMCGPAGMMSAVEGALETLRVDRDSIKKEYFETPVEQKPGGKEESDVSAKPVHSKATIILDDEEFEVEVEPGVTVLDACANNDIDAPYSCRGGVCSTCMAKVEEGKASMRLNYVLTDDEVEEGYILTCQSEPLTPTIKVDYDA